MKRNDEALMEQTAYRLVEEVHFGNLGSHWLMGNGGSVAGTNIQISQYLQYKLGYPEYEVLLDEFPLWNGIYALASYYNHSRPNMNSALWAMWVRAAFI